MMDSVADFRAERPRIGVALADACQAALLTQAATEPIYALCLAWTTAGESIIDSLMLVCAPDSNRRTADGGYDNDPYLVWNPMEWPDEMLTADFDVLPRLDQEIRDLCAAITKATDEQVEALISGEDSGHPVGIPIEESFANETMLLLRSVAADLAGRDLGFKRTDDFVAYELHLDAMDFDTIPEQATPAALALLQDRGLL